MSALSATQLSRMRGQVESRTMTDLCTFYRKAAPTAADKGQASNAADVVVLADVKCRVGTTQQGANEGLTAGQVKSKVRVDLFIPATTARPTDAEYVLITSQSNRRLEISGSNPVTDKIALKISCLEVQ